MRFFIRVAAVTAGASVLSACQTVRYLEAQSRVDPQTIALYETASGVTLCPSAYSGGQYILKDGRYVWVPDPTRVRARAPGDFRDGAFPLRCIQDGAGKSIYDAAIPAENPLNSRSVARNRLAAILMKQSDDVCTAELGRLTAREAMVNTFLNVTTSALATAGSLVAPESLKALLSGGASLSNATRTHINSEVYRNVLSTAVAKAIQNERKDLRKAAIDHFKDAADAYTVDQMVMDVNAYHQACSFFHGLTLVMDAVSRPTTTESEQLVRAQSVLAYRQLQLTSLQRQLAALGTNASNESKRAAVNAEIQTAEHAYQEALEAAANIGKSPTIAPPPSDTSGTVVPPAPPPNSQPNP